MNNRTVNSNHPFNELAHNYDAVFTNTDLGKLLRTRTHEHLAKLFTPGSNVLEINCGTGEDAAFLASFGVLVTATDESIEMINISRNKTTQRGLGDKVRLQVCRFEELDTVLDPHQKFDGIVSNFGGINCAEDVNSLSRILTDRVKPGGHIFFCIMGRWCPWEWFYLGARGQFNRVLQRIHGSCEWRGKTIRYYSPGQLIKSFLQFCKVKKVCGLGFLLPPTYVGPFVSNHLPFFRWLDALERKIESFACIPQLSDHFILILTKK